MPLDSVSQNEEWRDVVGYEGVYQVSSLGRVRRIVTKTGKPKTHYLTPSARPSSGYPYVNLSLNRVLKSMNVHRLVGMAFLGEPPTDNAEIRHINGNRHDNRAENLRWDYRRGHLHNEPEQLPDGYKFCRKCGESKPATLEYFKPITWRNILSGMCRDCIQETNRERHKVAPEIKKAQRARYGREKANADKRKAYPKHKHKIRIYQRAWDSRNREKLRQWSRDYGKSPEGREKKREWQRNNRDKLRAIYHRREARKRGLPDAFTAEDWQRALTCWNNSCAICGISFEERNPHADHVIPLASPDCLGTVPLNILPLCSHCNMSKSDNDLFEWMSDRYGVDYATERLAAIQAYFDYLRSLE